MVLRGHGPTRGTLKGALDGGKVWWIAPSYPVSNDIWRDLKKACKGVWLDKSEIERRIELPGGGSVTVRSADNPDSLRGAGLDGVVLDEAASIDEVAWKEVLRPALSDKQGWAVFIGTPKGHNWFWKLFEHAKGEGDWERWQRPSSDNALLSEHELAAARRESTALIAAQEYDAQFIVRTGSMFRPEWMPIVDKAPTCSKLARGWDKAATEGGGDYTAGVLLGVCGDTVYVIDVVRGQWSSGKRDANMATIGSQDYTAYGHRVSIEIEQEGGSGGKDSAEVSRQQLSRAGYRVHTHRVTGSKAARADALASRFEAGDVKLVTGRWNQDFIDELCAFPQEGMHDDQVDAASMAFNKLCAPKRRLLVAQ